MDARPAEHSDKCSDKSTAVNKWSGRHTQLYFKYRRRTKTITSAVAETYLRDDVPCGSDLCASGCATTASRLTANAPYYILPDADVLDAFLEVFELPDLANYVVLGSVMKQLSVRSNSRKLARMRALYRDPRRHCHLFSDQACLCTADMRTGGSQSDPVLTAAQYYWQHLDGAVPLVVVSDRLSRAADNSQGGGVGAANALADRLQQLHLRGGGLKAGQDNGLELKGATILSAAEFFSPAWPHSPAVLDLADTLHQARLAAAAEVAAAAAAAASSRQPLGGGPAGEGVGAGGTGRPGAGLPPALGSHYRPHLSQQEVEDGLAAGELLQGVLHVSRRDPREAIVQVGSGSDTHLGRLFRLVGRPAMNRALEGDSVAVRIVPSPAAVSALRARSASTPLPSLLSAGSGRQAAGEGGAEVDASAATAEPGAEGVDYGAELLNADAEEGGGVGVLGTVEGDALAHAEVVGILQRGTADVVASVSPQDEEALALAGGGVGRQEALLCVPADRRLPYVRVRTRQGSKLAGQRLVLRIDGWDRKSRYPSGHVVRVLGPVNDLRAESEALLVQCGVTWQPFCEAALAELPRVASAAEWDVPPAERASRRDLTGDEYFVCSIDPPNCTDVDDALHVRRLPDGGIEVGVHIADVSYFVRGGGMLDGEARSRCTTVYLVDRRLDMLPALLSEQLCSLRSGAERLAVSVIWRIDPPAPSGAGIADGPVRVRDVWFGRTLIRSRHQLSYQQAQDVLDGARPAKGDELPGEHLPVLRDGLQQLKSITDRLHAARLAAGALELASAELRFVVGPDGQPLEVETKAKVAMMDVVAEMMIWANSAVAERIATTYPGCALLRNHPAPRPEAFEQVRGLLEVPVGEGEASTASPVDASSNLALAAALSAACARQRDPAAALLIKALTTRAMSEAKYFSTGAAPAGSAGAYHFGLALPYYTHFTSPIRRYADVVVHRQLLCALAQPAASPPPMTHAALADAAADMNARHRGSKRAQKECSEMYLLLLLHTRPHLESAIVCGFQGNQVEVFVPRYQLRGRVQMVDRRGLVVLPLEEDDEQDTGAGHSGVGQRVLAGHDVFRDVERRRFRYAAEGASAEIRRDSDAGGGSTVVWRVEQSQRVWVRLAADGSRAHGPQLLIHLLSDCHPDALVASMAGTGTNSWSSALPGGADGGGGGGDGPAAARRPVIKMAPVPPPRLSRPDAAAAAARADGDAELLGPPPPPAPLLARMEPQPLGLVGAAAGIGGGGDRDRDGGGGGLDVAQGRHAALLRHLQAKVARCDMHISASSSKSTSRARWAQKLVEAQARLQEASFAAAAAVGGTAFPTKVDPRDASHSVTDQGRR